jgi:hypothetical protein
MLTTSLNLNENWDIHLNGENNLATVQDANAVSQDVASACKTHLGEVWFDTSIGIPWLTQILGKPVSAVFIQSQLEKQAKRLPYVSNARATVVTDRKTRTARGLIAIVDTDGQELAVIL